MGSSSLEFVLHKRKYQGISCDFVILWIPRYLLQNLVFFIQEEQQNLTILQAVLELMVKLSRQW